MRPYRTPLIIAGSILLGIMLAIMLGYPLSVYEPDYSAHLGIIRRLLDGTLSSIPYSGILGSHVLVAALMKATSITAQQAVSILFWVAQTLTLGSLVLASLASSETSAASPDQSRRSWPFTVGTYLLASSILVSMLLFRGYLPQIYSWPAYLLAYVSFFLRGRRLAGLGLLAFAGWIYPDGLIWMLPIFIWSLPLKGWPAVLIRGLAVGVVILLITQQVRHMGLEGGANTGWFETGVVPMFVLCCMVSLFTARPLASPLNRILALYLLIALGIALYSYLDHGAVRYYARKNFYFIGLLFPLLFTQWPTSRLRKLLLGACGVFFIVCLTSMNGSGSDIAVRELLRGSPPYDAADERLANRMRADLPGDCKGVLAIPRFQARAGNREDSYIELLTRVYGYNNWIDGCSIDGRLYAVDERLSNFYKFTELLVQATKNQNALDFGQLGIKTGACLLVSDRYAVTGGSCSLSFSGPTQDREGFRLCRIPQTP